MEIVKRSGSSVLGVVDESAIQGSALNLGDPKNGFFNLSFNANDLELWGDISPPAAASDLITDLYISNMLDRLNVIYGVKWDAIMEAINTVNLERKTVKYIPMAKGDPPVNSEAEYYELNPKLATSPTPATEDGQIDYKDYTPFVIVKEGQILARKRPRIPGREGRNVHGNEIPYRISVIKGYAGGENTRTDENYIYAEIHGQLVESKKVLSVQNTLVIRGGVDYHTGNIKFPGDVIIDGQVSDGFKIYSGGSVTIKQTFDVTESVIKKDLTVGGGIIGRGRAIVKVGGVVKTRFINNCRLAGRDNVYVTKEILRSNVYAMGAVDLGEKGIILGSSVYTIHGVRAKNIGTKFGKLSRIHCGSDFTIKQDKEKSTQRLKLIVSRLNDYRYAYDNMEDTQDGQVQRGKLKELMTRLEKEQSKASLHISELLDRINADENAVIQISGDISPGTFLEICQVSLEVTEPLHKVRIMLDNFLKKLVVQKLD
ncbi:MAG: FapA family protein [Treponema sp.]|jgi:uncharacterized protein (DUF342 family)|nr:FapA family protein [Treponema sp.]